MNVNGRADGSAGIEPGRKGIAIAHFLLGRCNPHSANGIDQCVYHVSRNQAAQGHDVSLYSLTGKPAIPIPGVRVRTYPPVFDLPFSRSSFISDVLGNRSPAAVPEVLVTELINSGPDLVHMHHTQVPANVVIGNQLRRRGIPYCVTLHGALVGEARNRRRVLKRAYRWFWEREHLDEAAFLHAISGADAAGARQSGLRAPIEIVPNGIDVDAQGSHEPARLGERFSQLEGRRTIVFVGRLDPMQKGLDLLCEALAESDTDLGLLIVGPSFRNGRAELEALVGSRGISEQVAFAGPAYGEEKWSILAGADAFAHTSRWEAGVPFSVLEAAAQGRACLLTEAADPDAILAAAGGSVRVRADVASVACGLRTLHEMSEKELKLMGSCASEAVRNEFNWSRIAESLLMAYRSHCRRR